MTLAATPPRTSPSSASEPGWGLKDWRTALATSGALVGVVLCLWAATRVQLAGVDDLGLAPMLGWQFWLGFVLLHVTFASVLCSRNPSTWLLVLLTGCLVLSVFGAAAMVTDIPRGEVTWRHLGVIDSLVRTGYPNPDVDAYFGWPGFFALFAAVGQATGLPLLKVALWASVWNNVLWLFAVGAILRQITTNRRQIWLAVWLFASVNWIDQDYFAPQAFAFLLYLVIIAVMLRWLRTEPTLSLRTETRTPSNGQRRLRAAVRDWWASRAPVASSTTSTRQRLIVLLVTVTLAAAMVSSHQLTPFATIIAVTALVLTGRSLAVRLPLTLVVLVACWLTYPGSTYLTGHPIVPEGGLGALGSTSVVGGLVGSPGHLVILRVRILLTLLVWALAVVGAVRLWRAGRKDIVGVTLVLACAPLLLLPMQSYGGEMPMRVTLFSLPFTTFLAAAALLPVSAASLIRSRTRLLIIVVCTVLGATSIVSRYGNTRFDMFSPGEIAAVDMLYREARPGDVLIGGAHPTPWRYRDYEVYKHPTLQELCLRKLGAAACYDATWTRVDESQSNRGLFLITKSSRAALRMQGMMSEVALAKLEDQLRTTQGVHVLLDSPDATLYELRR